MNREEFDHAVRAAGGILGVDEILVIGSQAVHGSIRGQLPEAALRSVEVDVAALGDEDGSQADLLDGSIGEASMFHESFGFYVQGVVAETAVLPAGWRERLVRYQSPATGGVVAWCLELHDLWISKESQADRRTVSSAERCSWRDTSIASPSPQGCRLWPVSIRRSSGLSRA